MIYRLLATTGLSLLLATPAALAHGEDSKMLETVRVHGRGLELIGTAKAASEGIVGYADFEDRPLSRIGELVEVIPGVVATQHSGEGKSNQYFLRGFNLDHGTDFSVSFDGVPVNLRSHGHGQGYLDLNFIIPEIVEYVDYRKGPYSAEDGDFSAAGSARYVTKDELDASFVELQAGENGYVRGVGAVNVPLSPTSNLILAAEGQVYDGPWTLEQDLEKINVFGKLSGTHESWNYHVSATAYDNSWTSTDQVPERAVESGLIGRFGNIDDDLGGSTTRYSLTGSADHTSDTGANTKLSAYFVDYEFQLFSNFTYLLEDPVNGDEFEQFDKRSYYGGRITHTRPMSDVLTLQLGAETRRDDISDIGLFRSADRSRLSTVRQDEIEETSIGLWAEARLTFSDRLRLNLGLRADYFDASVTSVSLPANSGSANDEQISPKLGLAWRATDNLELYANYGEGYHSNDARGATISLDPNDLSPAQPVPLLVKAEGVEIGARYERDAFKASVALFQLDLESELVFVGDGGATEANDASTRTGVETTIFWMPVDWITADASFAWTDAEFDIPGNERKIPNSVETVAAAGVTARLDPATFTLRLRHFGEAPLIEDGSVTSDPTTIVNFGARYDWQDITFGLDVLNLMDADDADITYFYESRLAGEAMGVEDRHFHPVEPRQIRVSVRYRF